MGFFYPISLKSWSWKWKNTCVSECKQSVILCDLWVLGGMFLLCKTRSVMCGLWLHPGSIVSPQWVWTFNTGHNQCKQTTVSESFIWIHLAERRMCDRVTQSKNQDKPIWCEPHNKYNPEKFFGIQVVSGRVKCKILFLEEPPGILFPRSLTKMPHFR